MDGYVSPRLRIMHNSSSFFDYVFFLQLAPGVDKSLGPVCQGETDRLGMVVGGENSDEFFLPLRPLPLPAFAALLIWSNAV